ncbi:MAG: trypsin [Acidobacteria bacterium]|nr:MAG: trypsin [Acidobacteriota bacterium]
MGEDSMRKFLAGAVLLVGLLDLATGSARAQSYSEVFKRVRDAVVVIRTAERDLAPAPGGRMVTVPGLGSGVLISADGQVLTAAHVVQTAEKIQVLTTGGEILGARVASSSPSADVALLQLERPPKKGAVAELGDPIFIVGAPLGISYTLTAGHISARRKMQGVYGNFSEAEFFQTDAAINPGNSGGPMFDIQGRVVGVVPHGLGFVVTSNMARDLLLQQKSLWTGFEGYMLSGELAKVFNLPQAAGILVQRVAEHSPATEIGLQPGTMRAEIEGESLIVGGDIILEVQGIRVSEPGAADRIRQSISKPAGQTVTVKVLRAGRTVELTTKVERP